MISKKISDLKDIKFEISTALQFEPSQQSVHVDNKMQTKKQIGSIAEHDKW